MPAAYLRQKFVRPLLTKDGGIIHHRPSAAGDEPPGAIGRGIFPPLSAVEIWLGNGARGRGDALFVRGLWARAIRIRGGTHVGVVCLFG